MRWWREHGETVRDWLLVYLTGVAVVATGVTVAAWGIWLAIKYKLYAFP